MKLPLILAGGMLALAGCETIIGAGAGVGVSRDTFALCSEMLRAELANEASPDGVQDRLKAAGVMCLVAAVDDVLTVTPAPATPGEAGEVVAEDRAAAAAID